MSQKLCLLKLILLFHKFLNDLGLLLRIVSGHVIEPLFELFFLVISVDWLIIGDPSVVQQLHIKFHRVVKVHLCHRIVNLLYKLIERYDDCRLTLNQVCHIGFQSSMDSLCIALSVDLKNWEVVREAL